MTEALACGTPVVATAMGSVPEIVGEDGEVGVLAGVNKWDEMVEAIKRREVGGSRSLSLPRSGRGALQCLGDGRWL